MRSDSLGNRHNRKPTITMASKWSFNPKPEEPAEMLAETKVG